VSESLAITLPPEIVEAIAQRAAEIVLAEQDRKEPRQAAWMTVEQASDYSGLSVAAIRHLIERRKLPKHQAVERGRIIFRRSDPDAYLARETLPGPSRSR
jgi:excisionase family DNA binding protein